MFDGADIVTLANKHIDEPYVLGATVHMANKRWKGPWDCAEFVSWCAYQSYSILFGVKPPNADEGESYSGWWQEEAERRGLTIPVEQAIATPGALLVRKPGAFGRKVGHVAISCGDGSTVEAHSARIGVQVIADARQRPWTCGAVLPGVRYASAAVGAKYSLPKNLFMIRNPFMRGDAVKKIQEALSRRHCSPGTIDGVFGHQTSAAVASFQAREGLVVDGCVGPQTAEALGL